MPDIDIHDLKKNTEYNGYRPADKEIGWFWNIMFSLSRSDKAEFLQFVTGSSKVPLAGFSELQGMRGVQKFSITKVVNQESSLPSAHTCKPNYYFFPPAAPSMPFIHLIFLQVSMPSIFPCIRLKKT